MAVSSGRALSTSASRAASSGWPSTPVAQRRQLAPDRIAPIAYQRPGRAWQKLCTPPAGLPSGVSVTETMAALVPSEIKLSPPLTAPIPTAETGLSPPPAATTTFMGKPSWSATLASTLPVAASPSASAGSWSRRKPQAATMGGNQARAASSSHRVPAASDMSVTLLPVKRRRR